MPEIVTAIEDEAGFRERDRPTPGGAADRGRRTPDAAPSPGAPLMLSLTEHQLLGLLARDPGRVVSREELLHTLRGLERRAARRALAVNLGCLRVKLADSGRRIQSVPGGGFRLVAARAATGTTAPGRD